MFGKEWQDGTATIVERQVTRAAGADSGNRYRYVVDVEVGAATFRTTMHDPLHTGGFAPPIAGQVVAVKVDIAKQKAKFARGGAGTTPADATAAQLQQLDALHAEGRIPEAAYEQMRAAIVNGTAVIGGRRYRA